MESAPLISIVLPLFNKEKWIVPTLESVARQSYKKWECIIVDDGSTDGGLSLVEKFISTTPGNWKLVSQTNAGQSRARNAGIELATGELIAFLDSDDLWLPRKLEEQVDFLGSHPHVDALVSEYTIFEQGQVSGLRVVSHRSPKRMILGWLTMRGFGGLIESTGIVKRSTLERIGGFNEALSTSAGLDLSVRLFTDANLEILHFPQVLYRISLEQWHKDEESLKRDLAVLSSLYSQKLDGLRNMDKWHKSYFVWQIASKGGNEGRFGQLLRSVLKLDLRDLAMFYSLSSRNIVAWVKGRRVTINYEVDFDTRS